MKREKLILLLHKKLKGELSEQEQTYLADQLREEEQRQMADDIEKVWKLSGKYKAGYQPDAEAGLARFREKINADKKQGRQAKIRQLNRRRLRMAAAAVILLISAGMVWQWLGRPTAAPILTATTGAGEKLEVTLADGSTVLLNENSRLSYPGDFKGRTSREVLLLGEAYFSVKADAAQRFCIKTAETEVCVIGTAFNLRAYPSENFTEVEVESGKVAFRKLDGEAEMVLGQNERGVIRHSNAQAVQEAAPELNGHAWRTGRLLFRKASIQEVETTLERHFKIELGFDPPLNNCSFNLDFEEEKLEDVLALIAGSFNAEVEKEGEETYLIKGGSCN